MECESPARAVPGRPEVRKERDGEERLSRQRGPGELAGAGRSKCIADSDQPGAVQSDSDRLGYGTDSSGHGMARARLSASLQAAPTYRPPRRTFSSRPSIVPASPAAAASLPAVPAALNDPPARLGLRLSGLWLPFDGLSARGRDGASFHDPAGRSRSTAACGSRLSESVSCTEIAAAHRRRRRRAPASQRIRVSHPSAWSLRGVHERSRRGQNQVMVQKLHRIQI